MSGLGELDPSLRLKFAGLTFALMGGQKQHFFIRSTLRLTNGVVEELAHTVY